MITRSLALSLCMLTQHASPCIQYDLNKSKTFLIKALTYGENWEYVTDNDRGINQFSSAEDVLLHAEVLSMPVASLKFKDARLANAKCEDFEKDTVHFYAFLLKSNKPLGIIHSTFRCHALTDSSQFDFNISVLHEKTNIVYKEYEKHKKSFFFCSDINTYVFFVDKSTYAWDPHKGLFVLLK